MRHYDTYQDWIFFKNEMVLIGDEFNNSIECVEGVHHDGKHTGRSFVDDELKFFISLNSSFFHLLLEDFGSVLSFMKKNPNIHFILSVNQTLISDTSLESMLSSLMIVFKENKIKHSIINAGIEGPVRINNFYFHKGRFTDKEGTDAVVSIFTKRWNTSSIVADKKVYLSRSKVRKKGDHGLFLNEPKDKFSFVDDIRLYNEHILEEFLVLHGFDIIYPEDFSTFEEQVKFFASVKLLVSTTGAGLANMIFMKKGSTIIELTTSLIAAGREDVHSHYQGIAYTMDQTYISLPVMRDSYKAVSIIKKSEGLIKIINE